LISDRIKSGRIDEKYRLDFIKEKKKESLQPALLESKGKYNTKKSGTNRKKQVSVS